MDIPTSCYLGLHWTLIGSIGRAPNFRVLGSLRSSQAVVGTVDAGPTVREYVMSYDIIRSSEAFFKLHLT